MDFSLTPTVEATLWGAVGGAAGLALVGFMFGGWVTGSKAKEMAQQQADKAVVAVVGELKKSGRSTGTTKCSDKLMHFAERVIAGLRRRLTM